PGSSASKARGQGPGRPARAPAAPPGPPYPPCGGQLGESGSGLQPLTGGTRRPHSRSLARYGRHRRPRSPLQPGGRRHRGPARRALRLAAGLGPHGLPASDRPHARAALLPALPRLLRPCAAAAGRGRARGRAPATPGEHDGHRLPGRRGARLVARLAALALVAAGTGFCAGCELYRLAARLRGISPRHHGHLDPADLPGLDGAPRAIVEFTHPLCSDCRAWERRLRAAPEPLVVVDVRERPELARKYGIAIVPTVLAVAADGMVLERLAP